MLNLNLLFELATSKCDHFKTQITDNIRTAGTIENPTIPITHIIADTSEMRAYCKDDSTKIVGEATNAIKSFVTGGSENVISGVGALIGAGINMLMGSGEGVQAEHSDYFIMVDGLALVRIDIKSWIRKVTVVGITQKIESVLAFTAVKSSVDVDKISFNTFMEAYKYQLQRDAAHALNENDLMKEIKRAKEVYNLLKTDSAESTLVFDTLKLPGQNILTKKIPGRSGREIVFYFIFDLFVHHLVVFLIISTRHMIQPLLIFQIPFHSLFNTFFKL